MDRGEGRKERRSEKNVQMLATLGNTRRPLPRSHNIVHKPGQRRDAPDEECHHGAPITPKFRRVPVHAVEVVHIGHTHIPVSHDVVIRNEDGCHRAQEDGVATEEGEEFRGRGEDLPGDEGPGTDNGGEKLAAANVDVARREGHEVVRGRNGVGRDVDAEGDDDEAYRGEGGGSAAPVRTGVHPHVDDVDGVPHYFPISGLRGGSGEDAQETDDGCDSG